MKRRMDHYQVNPEAYNTMQSLERFTRNSGLDKKLLELVKYRASQINGCAFCLDMHAKELFKLGESADRLVLVSAWREVPGFTKQERAALELTEYVTNISAAGVPDDVYDRVQEQFSEQDIVSLIMAINTINSWNRIAITTGMFPGCLD